MLFFDKLFPTQHHTINLVAEFNMKANSLCKEIYVFNIRLKEKRIPIDFIKAFDRNIELHTYFIFEFEEEFYGNN